MKELKLVASVQDKGVLQFMDALQARGKAVENTFRQFSNSVQQSQQKMAAVGQGEIAAVQGGQLQAYGNIGKAAEDAADKVEKSAARRKDASQSATQSEIRAQSQIIAAQKQADIAAAKLLTDRWERAKAIENANHAYQKARYAGNNAALEAEGKRHVAAMAGIEVRKGDAAKTAAQVAQSASGVGIAAANEEKAATEARTRAYEEWLQKVNSTPVVIGNREKLANYGPMQGPPTASQAARAAKFESRDIEAIIERRIARQEELTREMQREAVKRQAISQQETYTLTAHDKLLLAEEKRTYLARASSENDFFQRQRQTLRAHTLQRLKLYANDAQMVEQIRKTHLTKLEAINNREKGFANTPFQTMLRQQNVAIKQSSAFVGMMGKMGLSSRQAGQAMTMAGYQVGDFAVQVGSGQGAMRAFLQQGTQLVQFFGPWGSVIGAAGAVLGALWIGLKRSKDEAKGLSETTLPEWLQDTSKFRETVDAFNALATAQEDFARQKAAPQLITNEHGQQVLNYVDALNRATVSEKAFKEATGQSTEEFEKKIGAFMSMEQLFAASQAKIYAPQIEALEDFQRARIDAMADGIEKSLALEDLGLQKALRQEKARYAEALLAAKGNMVLMGQAQANFVVVSNALAQTAAQKKLNIEKEAGKKAVEEAKAAGDAILAAEAQTQRMRIEAQMVGSAKAVALTNAEYDERVRAHKENAAVVAQIEQQRALALEAIRVGASRREAEEHRKIIDGQQAMEQRRLEVLYAGNEKELLAIRQQAESRRLAEEYNAQLIRDVQEGNYAIMEERYAAHQDALTATAFIHEQERQQLATKTIEENAKKIVAANEQIAASAFTIAGNFADAFGFERANKFLGVLQKIKTTMEAMAAIRQAVNALSLAGGAFNPLSLIGLGGFSVLGEKDFYANGGRPPVGKPAVVGERGPELFIPDAAGTVYSNEDSRRMLARAAAPVIPASIYQQAPPTKPTASTASTVTVQGMNVTVNIPAGATPAQAEELGEAAARGAASGIGYLSTQRGFLDTQRTAAYDRVFG